MALTESMVTLDSGLSLSIARRGDRSAPALVLLPGPTDAWRSYGPVLERLPDSINVVAVSPRGHGDSDKLPTGYGIADFAADVPLLLDAVGVARAVLAGHSGSCLVARRVALDHPDRVAGLVLEASPTTLRGHPGLRELLSVVSALEESIDREFARSFVADTSSDRVPAALVERLIEDVVKVPGRVWKEMFSSLLEYDDTADLGCIVAPSLLVWGDADGLVDQGMQRMLLGLIRASELTVYEGAGHTPRWEDPRRFSRDVAAFVEARASTGEVERVDPLP